MSERLDWQSKGVSAMGDEHGPIYIYEATTDKGVRIRRRRKRGTVSVTVYEVPAICRVYNTLGHAMAMADIHATGA